MSISEKEKTKVAQLIIDWCGATSSKNIDQLILEIRNLLFPAQLGSYCGPRDKIKDLLNNFKNTGSGLEKVVEGIYRHLENHFRSVNNTYTPTPSNNSSKFTRRQQDALSLKHVTTKEDLNYILESIIDDYCIHKVEVSQLPCSGYTYYAEFTDKRQGVILFKLLLTANRSARSPEEIVLETLKSYYSEYRMAGSVLMFDIEKGKIVQR